MKTALISVSDKTGIIAFAQQLAAEGITILSTGGTAKALQEAGIATQEVSNYTGFPELFEGRVKTLHPKVHGGLLYRRDSAKHCEQAEQHDIPAIDLVVVNLYPFQATVAQPNVTYATAIEQIDIGGPSMLRSAAKNAADVTVVVDPSDYDSVLTELQNNGKTSLQLRQRLAAKVFQTTAEYDRAIAEYLSQQNCAESGDNTDNKEANLIINSPFERKLRYGDNPHQNAAIYGNFFQYITQKQGKELSYTNILDIESAIDLIAEFNQPTVAILKHTNPCGVGQHEDDLRIAWERAYRTDKDAPFGGVIVCNRMMDGKLARIISAIFTDVIIAPEFDAEARSILQKKKNLRLIKVDLPNYKQLNQDAHVIRSVPGGFIKMAKDSYAQGLANIEAKVVSKRPPTQAEISAMKFAWKVVKNVKSNAIVYANSHGTLGIGAGQMSRVDSSRLAVWKAEQAKLDLTGSVIASDALFPFADGVEAAIAAGATACIQPGGSKRDEEVIAAANQHNMAMVFTSIRHFKH